MRKISSLGPLLLLMLVGTLWLSACGGGSGSTPGIPTVASVAPADGATDVAVNSSVTITFSAALDCSTVTTASIVLSAGKADESGAVACNGSSVTFTPTVDLTPFTDYTLDISADVVSAAGTAINSAFSYSFTTGNVADSIAPKAGNPFPAVKAFEVAVDAIISVDFNEPLVEYSINRSTFLLVDRKGVSVAGTVDYDAAGNSATFAPAVQLHANTEYTVTVVADIGGDPNGAGVLDLAGNGMLQDYVWFFTTGADKVSPTITAVDPFDGETDAWIGNPISITFDDRLDLTNFKKENFRLTVGIDTPVDYFPDYDPVTSVFTFNPGPLAIDGNYTVTIAAGVADLAGNILGKEYVWSFTATRPTLTAAPTFAVASSGLGAEIEVTVPVTANAYNFEVCLVTIDGGTGGCSYPYENFDRETSITLTIPTDSIAPAGDYYPVITLYDFEYRSGQGFKYDAITSINNYRYEIFPGGMGDSGIAIPFITLEPASDLTVRIDTLTLFSTDVTIYYTVTNTGLLAAAASTVDFFLNPTTVPVPGDVGDLSKAVPALAAGGSYRGTVVLSDAALEDLVYAVADSGLAVSEGNESNNVINTAVVPTPDAYEPDDTIYQASYYTEPQLHNYVDNANDWVIFYAAAGTTYTIETVALGLNANTALDLYGTDGEVFTLIASDDDSGTGLASKIVWTPTYTNEFFVDVSCSADTIGGGTEYTLIISGQ